jgi:hypothetical protein
MDMRRETVDGLNRRISSIHRTYSSTCGRDAAKRVPSAISTPGEVGTQVGLGKTRDRPLNRARYAATARRRTLSSRTGSMDSVGPVRAEES